MGIFKTQDVHLKFDVSNSTLSFYEDRTNI